MTIGADFAIKEVEVSEGSRAGQSAKLQIWDLAGQQHFSTVRSVYYRRAHGAIIVYDCTRIATMENLEQWIVELQNAMPNKIPVVLIANKADLRAMGTDLLTKEDGEKMARRLSMVYLSQPKRIPCFETSAKTGQNVETAFQAIINQIYA